MREARLLLLLVSPSDRTDDPLQMTGNNRQARVTSVANEQRSMQSASPVANRAVFVDLNNFATFPTMAIGILAASLRNAGYQVEVVCPLAHDVPSVERERRERYSDHVARRVHLSTHPLFRVGRDSARTMRGWWRARPHRRVLREVGQVLAGSPDILLLSAYLQHYETVVKLCAMAAARGVPVLLGGAAFNHERTAEVWRRIPGVTAVVGGEMDLSIPELVQAVLSGDDLLRFPGVVLPDGSRAPTAPPLHDLDRLPVPDYTDFPWDRYRTRVLPLMTGRGCQWNRCVFCSDIVSVSGRTYRTKSIEAVMHEVRELSVRHECNNFLFLDLKLNSHPALLRGITEQIQRNAPGAQWIGTVHVDQRKDNGLSRSELRAAAGAGLRRVSFGLESGSQDLLDKMDKGCSVAANSQFIRDAHAAGISVRCTMFKGFPGETAADMNLTADFLEQHLETIDRVRFNEFSVLDGTPVYDAVTTDSARYPDLELQRLDEQNAALRYRNRQLHGRDYRRAKLRVLAAVHAINRREVRSAARAFDGMM